MGEDFGESKTFIGDVKHPLWIGKKKDMASLMTEEAYFYIDLWQKYNMGFGLPFKGHWLDADEALVSLIIQMENHYRVNFSPEAATIKMLQLIVDGQGIITKQIGLAAKATIKTLARR